MTTRLDGNAIAGELFDVFGQEMTTAMGTCASCGSMRPLGELAVYLQAPGVVARCSSCEALMAVIVEIRGIRCVDLQGIAALEHG
ncbi:hypothetical protein GCM10009609_69750 [Pseudonocardia aurantiaca]|uniref:DUF6510 family protein n=1 Tax=Pseudonocardia aurantiaca TaxID=75290 RepID=A0ABW4FQT0_9PSEU